MPQEGRATVQSTYEIEFEGTLEVDPSAWLNGLSCCTEVRLGKALRTRLVLRLADQAALRGVLNRLWDLNLTLTYVRKLEAATDKETEDGC